MTEMLKNKMKVTKVQLFYKKFYFISNMYIFTQCKFSDTEEASETDLGKSEEYTEIKEQ